MKFSDRRIEVVAMYQNWSKFLKSNSGSLSPEVIFCAKRINFGGKWWLPSINKGHLEARECRQAVTIRTRLGSESSGGIPLWAELKSVAGMAVSSRTGETVYFAAHTRANTEFDYVAIVKSLGLDESIYHARAISASDESGGKLADDEMNIFGRVNPFTIDSTIKRYNPDIKFDEIAQIFDMSLFLFGGYPDTVMSNMNDRKYAFEMHPKDIFETISLLGAKTCKATIAEPCDIWLGSKGKQRKDYWSKFPPVANVKIGILTGNSPESGLVLWQDILNIFRQLFESSSDCVIPEIILHSLPSMGLSMELIQREEMIWVEMKDAISKLLQSGCKFLTVACNTTIYFEQKIRELCIPYDAVFISIAEACIPEIKEKIDQYKSTSIGIVGIGPVVDMLGNHSGYRSHLENLGVEIFACEGEDLAFSVKSAAALAVEKLINKFVSKVEKKLPNQKIVILALTEISIIYRKAQENKRRKSGIIFIDPLHELAKNIIFRYLDYSFKTNKVCQIPEDKDIVNHFMERYRKLENQ